jgi:acyl-CoA reductase-like NAD-dependent aldehyde dehydrogenase
MAKTIVDYIPEADYARYNELLDIAAKLKAKAPKPERKPRGPLTVEQKRERTLKRIADAEAKLAALMAAEQAAEQA